MYVQNRKTGKMMPAPSPEMVVYDIYFVKGGLFFTPLIKHEYNSIFFKKTSVYFVKLQ